MPNTRRSAPRIAAKLLLSMIFLSGCLPSEPPLFMTEQEQEAPLMRHQQTAGRLANAETGQLVVDVRDVNVMARELRINARVTNLHQAVVEGVRYQVEFLSTDGERSLGKEYLESGDVIQPGETGRARLVLESMYTQTIPRLAVRAAPIDLGGEPQPAPEGWSN